MLVQPHSAFSVQLAALPVAPTQLVLVVNWVSLYQGQPATELVPSLAQPVTPVSTVLPALAVTQLTAANVSLMFHAPLQPAVANVLWAMRLTLMFAFIVRPLAVCAAILPLLLSACSATEPFT
jgi:hypothetical protein